MRVPAELPRVLPVFPLRGTVLMPHGRLPLHVFEPRYRALVRDVLAGAGVFGMIQHRAAPEAEPAPPLYLTGCAGRIAAHRPLPDGRHLLVLAGLCRFDVVEELPVETPYRQVEASYERWLHDLEPPAELPEVRARILPRLARYLESLEAQVELGALAAAPLPVILALCATTLPFAPEEKQAVLEARTPEAQAAVLEGLLEIHLAGGAEGGRPN
ncbi:Lon protease 2 [bacterium HR39]|nr:Lon protease 2 [bacterium HR39]